MMTVITERERYIKTLTFGNPDKIPLNPGGPRESTILRWRSEGLVEGMDPLRFIYETLGIDRGATGGDTHGFFLNTKMNPMFEEKVLKHENDHYIVRDWMGAVVEISDAFDVTYLRSAKDFVTRKWHKFPVETREDWERMRTRYDANDISRMPENLREIADQINGRDFPLSVSINGPFWQLREWMGMENLCVAFLDEPEFVGEMIEFWCGFVARLLEKSLSVVRVDRVQISEDMAYKAHSMISPQLTRRFLQPVYEKWAAVLRACKVPVIDMDSDGFVEDLIPVWIDSGISACNPIEAAAHNDIVKYRRMFGQSMAYSGGIDKRAIAAGGETMKAEVMRVVPPLLAGGGFIPGCDHGVPPDISLHNFMEYTELLAHLTGWL
ncbi:MAG: hypothetical protein FWF05_06170 [Oscillospiraceae bacterium]|nr:hypothetical protein [Oscillospiraceae bacterium]